MLTFSKQDSEGRVHCKVGKKTIAIIYCMDDGEWYKILNSEGNCVKQFFTSLNAAKRYLIG